MDPGMGLPAFLGEGERLWGGDDYGHLGCPVYQGGRSPEFSGLRPYHADPSVVTPRLVRVDGEVVQGPDEGEVHGGVVGGMALQGQVVT